MAKIHPANIAPDALPRFRGNVIAYINRFGVVVAKWPRKRGTPTNPNVQWTSQQFSIASRMAANAEPMSMETARYLVKGTVWLPRDMLVMAAFGKAYELTLPDGTVSTQAYHGPPDLAPQPATDTRMFLPNTVNGVDSALLNTGTFAFKGQAFVLNQAVDLSAVIMNMTPAATAAYAACVAALDNSNVIQSVQFSSGTVFTDLTRQNRQFDISVTLAPGVRYAVMCGRTNGADNYAMPVSNAAGASIALPGRSLGLAQIAKAVPAVGQAVTVSGTPYAQTLIATWQ
jgi:hypothetical protein